MVLLRWSLRHRWVVVLRCRRHAGPGAHAHGPRPQELPAGRRPIGVRDQGPGPGRHVAGGHLRDPRPHRPRGPQSQRRGLHADFRGRRRPADRQRRDGLRADGAAGPAAVRPVRDDELRPRGDPAAVPQAGPADQRLAGGRLLRRRNVAGRRAIHDRRPRHETPGPVLAKGDAGPPPDARRRGRRFVAGGGQAAVRRDGRSRQGRRPGRLDRRRGQHPAAAGGRRQGQRLQRERRAVRGPRAGDRRGPQPAHGAGHGLHSLVQERQGHRGPGRRGHVRRKARDPPRSTA